MDGWYYSNPEWSNLFVNREICQISEIWHIFSVVKSLIRGLRIMVVVSVMFIMHSCVTSSAFFGQYSIWSK